MSNKEIVSKELAAKSIAQTDELIEMIKESIEKLATLKAENELLRKENEELKKWLKTTNK